MTIEVPPELFAEWLAEGRRQYSEPALIAGFVAEKTAEWAADQQLEACCEWLRNDHDAYELVGLRAVYLDLNLRAAMRPKLPSLKEQALKIVADYGVPMYRYTAEETTTIRRALESIPDADS